MDLLDVLNNDFQKIDCDEVGISLTKGGVSPASLVHALQRTSLPQTSIHQHIQGAPVRVGDEG
jgi:hypothetical protein